jgi:hypothetical protein
VEWYPYGIRLRDASVRPFVVTRRAQVSTHAASPFDLGAGRAGLAETLPAETRGLRVLLGPGSAFPDGVTLTTINTSYTRFASLI